MVLGPTSEQFVENLSRLRKERGWSFKELSEVLLEDAHRAVPPLGLRRMESGERRVDIDDLMALATVFEVSPATLLLPADRSDRTCEVTGFGTMSTEMAWFLLGGTQNDPPKNWREKEDLLVSIERHTPRMKLTLDKVATRRASIRAAWAVEETARVENLKRKNADSADARKAEARMAYAEALEVANDDDWRAFVDLTGLPEGALASGVSVRWMALGLDTGRHDGGAGGRNE
jgi:transcriptional regulator with XRE-family HTH domain